jgi:carbonic anhydrase
LLEGNERFVQGRLLNERRGDVRRAKIAEGQEPFAIILGCSDSRVPPEVLFDQGLGELFVVRVAGNTASDPVVVGSIEYAAEHLGSVLLVVLGHERCGAVEGAVQVVTEGAREPGSIGEMIAPVVPAVEEVSRSAPDLPQEELVSRSVRANVKRNVEQLESREPLLGHLIEQDELKAVGAEYDLETGEVKLV